MSPANTRTIHLHGVIPPIVTPMHPDGSLNMDAVPVIVEHMLVQGVHGIFAPGSQGEAFALTANERVCVLEAVLAAVAGRVPVIAGTGAITTHEAIQFTQQAERAGADAAAILTPYFISPTQDELYAHYAAIAGAVTLPLLAYSNPARTGGLKLAAGTLARLAHDIPHFIGVKDSSGDLSETAAILRACPPGFHVFVGRDTLFYPGLCMGAVGAVALSANVVPGMFVELYDTFLAGDHSRSRELQAQIALVRDGLPGFGSYPAPVKAALEILGLPAGPPRLPIQPINETQRDGLRALLRQVGLAV